MTNEYNPDGKEIRFIDSHYKDLFHIPDGSCVQIHYPDEMVVKPCTFIDEYHTQIGYNVFHICQFAEIMERNGASYMPEPEIMGDEAAWKVGKDRILAVQTCEDGYDYTLLDENYNEIDGGQVDNPELSMLEVRRDILESFGLERRELRAMFYEDVMEQAFEVGRQAVVVNDPIAELAFKLDRFAENFDPYDAQASAILFQPRCQRRVPRPGGARGAGPRHCRCRQVYPCRDFRRGVFHHGTGSGMGLDWGCP